MLIALKAEELHARDESFIGKLIAFSKTDFKNLANCDRSRPSHIRHDTEMLCPGKAMPHDSEKELPDAVGLLCANYIAHVISNAHRNNAEGGLLYHTTEEETECWRMCFSISGLPGC